jgi:CheY-like chemotaxis protein
MLPKISGVDVIKAIRGEADFSKLPVIVFSNTYLTNLVQDAWKAGATKCISKINCPPQVLLELMRSTIGGGDATPQGRPQQGGAPSAKSAPLPGSQTDAVFLAELRDTFIAGLPATLATLRASLQNLVKSDTEPVRLKNIHDLYRRVHAINGNAGICGLVQIAHLAAAFEALLKELHEKPKNINPSTLRTAAAAVDFLGLLFNRRPQPEKQEIPDASVLVVDDEIISRRAIIYAIQKAQLKSVDVDNPTRALELLAERQFDLICLDVNLPDMNGYELCTRLRNLPFHKKTPVIFVTGLNDFDNRASSMMAGGNDFITKPFLFIELTVKALIYVLRGKLQPVQ